MIRFGGPFFHLVQLLRRKRIKRLVWFDFISPDKRIVM